MNTDPSTPQGWHAELKLGFEPRGARSVLAGKRQRGPLTVQRTFHPEGGPCHVYILHPPGGVVGGDSLAIDIEVTQNAHALLTTPGAAKFYRSAGPLAGQIQKLKIEPGGILEWFPLESILFPGARLQARTEIELSGDARFFGWEMTSLGRPVIQERFRFGYLDAALSVRRDGRPLLLDRMRIGGSADLDGPCGLRGHPVYATLIATGANASDLESARAAAQAPPDMLLGITLIDDLLIARCLADLTEPVQQVFCRIWTELRPRLIGRPACPPRIWAT